MGAVWALTFPIFNLEPKKGTGKTHEAFIRILLKWNPSRPSQGVHRVVGAFEALTNNHNSGVLSAQTP